MGQNRGELGESHPQNQAKSREIGGNQEQAPRTSPKNKPQEQPLFWDNGPQRQAPTSRTSPTSTPRLVAGAITEENRKERAKNKPQKPKNAQIWPKKALKWSKKAKNRPKKPKNGKKRPNIGQKTFKMVKRWQILRKIGKKGQKWANICKLAPNRAKFG